MNLTTLKASAELAKTSRMELDLWQESLEPDEVLRLVEVALSASLACDMLELSEPNHAVTARLSKALEDMYTSGGNKP